MTPASSKQRDLRYVLNLVDVVQDGIICTDCRGHLFLANLKALAMWGYAEEEILGQSCQILFVEEDRLHSYPLVLQETQEKGSYQGEILFRRKDGGRFPGHLRSCLLSGEGEEQDLVFVIRDLTEQKRLQQRLLDSQKVAFLGKVVDGLSHELRNPIVTLSGYARRLEHSLAPDHPGHEHIRIILEEVQRMEAMLKEIEGYVQFAQVHRLAFTKVDLHSLMGEVLNGLRIPECVRLEEGYPPEGPWIYGDPVHLKELFHHLLENAIEAMPDGGVLGIRMEVATSTASVTIRDTGVGIPEQALPDIYSPFFTTKTKGAGVGLAKSYIIVEEHSGQIEVQSGLDLGTVFRVSFPLDRRQRPRRDDQALLVEALRDCGTRGNGPRAGGRG
jgi:PAS domain S-box-containing protein